MARGTVIAALALLVIACAPPPSGQPASAPELNVSGVLDRGFSPTCPTGEPCDPAPFANALIFTGPTGAQTRVNVNPDGQFAVHLDAGAYIIAAVPPPFQARVVPSSANVPATGTVFLSLRIAH